MINAKWNEQLIAFAIINFEPSSGIKNVFDNFSSKTSQIEQQKIIKV